MATMIITRHDVCLIAAYYLYTDVIDFISRTRPVRLIG